MRKQALQAITMLVLIITIAFVTAVISANAQTSLKLKASVSSASLQQALRPTLAARP